jgi:hypothetical protein
MKDLLPVNGFFTDSLSHRDPELYAAIDRRARPPAATRSS